MEFEESIYNLIPKEQYVPEKQKRYKSQYPADLQPTSSTFGLGTTSKPVCSNLSGKFNLEGGSHYHKGPSATFGQAKGALQPKTDTFKKKGTGNPVLIQKQEGKFQPIAVFHCLLSERLLTFKINKVAALLDLVTDASRNIQSVFFSNH